MPTAASPTADRAHGGVDLRNERRKGVGCRVGAPRATLGSRRFWAGRDSLWEKAPLGTRALLGSCSPGLRAPWRRAACGRVLRGTGRGLGAKTALPVAETVTRVHSTLLPGKWAAVCFQNSLLFLFLDDCFSQMSKK